MKRSSRLSIAIVLTLLLVIISASAWAESGRKGTVPIPPRNYPGRCGDLIFFGFGTVHANGAECKLNVKLIKDPTKFFQPSLEGWSYLYNYVVDVILIQGNVDSVEICVTLIPDWEDKIIGETINWYRWDENQKEWVAIPTTIQDGTPKMICGTSTEVGAFSLQGK